MKQFAAFLSSIAMSMLLSLSSHAEGLSQQDYIEIEQLYARYNHTIDSGDAASWADTFTADGVFNNTYKGREALMGFIKQGVERRGGVLMSPRRHWNSNLKITGDGKTATGSVYLILLDISTKPASIGATGIYFDNLVKTPQGWRFTQRVVKGDSPPATATQPAAK